MRRVVLLCVTAVVLALATPAVADTITLLWTGDPSATSYQIEQRAEGVAVWTVVPAAQLTLTCTGTPAVACQAVVTGVSGVGPILFRFAAVNAVATTIRYNAGAWYCGSCRPPVAPAQTGVQ